MHPYVWWPPRESVVRQFAGSLCDGTCLSKAFVCGATFVGVIGTLGANLPFIGVTLVGLVLAAGWAANKFKAATRKG